MNFEEFKQVYYSEKGFETVEQETENAPVHDGKNWNTPLRMELSKAGDVSVLLEDAEKYANLTMEDGLLANNRLHLKNVVDSEITKRILDANGFDESEYANAVVLFIPSNMDVMGKAKWVLSKYATKSRELAEIKVYDAFNHKSNVIGYGVNVMETDYGFQLVIGGRMNGKTYVAPYQLIRALSENNTLDNQVFNGYLLGLTDEDKLALKYNKNSNYSLALRQNAYNLVSDEENESKITVIDETEHNAWAFRAVDGYYQRQKEFYASEFVFDLSEYVELLLDQFEILDWRKSAETIADAVIMATETELRDLVNFWSIEQVIDEIESVDYDKKKFPTVQSELIKFAEYLWELEAEEDNSFSVLSNLEDYDSDDENEDGENRGYKKAYRNKELEEKAIARGVITEFLHSKHYSRSFECHMLKLERDEVRASSNFHEELVEQAFEEIKDYELFIARMERELGVSGLTEFKLAVELENGGK